MKTWRQLEKGEVVTKIDVVIDPNGGFISAESWAGKSYDGSYMPTVLRPVIPKPAYNWRKISDGPYTELNWVANGNRVKEGTLYNGRPYCLCMSPEWNERVTHWMPRTNPPSPPELEKTEEEIAFDKFMEANDGKIGFRTTRGYRLAWKAGMEFMKQQHAAMIAGLPERSK